jgi:hypothetical protein
MQVGTLIKYKHVTTESLGVIVGIEKPTRRLGGGPVYKIQWVDAHPLVIPLQYLQSDSLVKVS